MAAIALILIILANVKTEIDGAATESRLNQLLGTFPLQIKKTEQTPAASAGNNLNDDARAQPISRKDFQAISQTSPLLDKKSKDGGGKHQSSFIGPNEEDGERLNLIKPLPMVWENCMETTFRENQDNSVNVQDMENLIHDYPIKNHEELTNTWNKRDAQNYNVSAARNAWIEKYNSLLNSRADERRQQKLDLVPVKKFTSTTIFDTAELITTTTSAATTHTPPSTTPTSTNYKLDTADSTTTSYEAVAIIPITREVFREEIEIKNVTDRNIVPSYAEDWFDIKVIKNRTKTRFSSLPQRTTYLIPALGLEKGLNPFSFMSDFFYLIYPFEFPVGKF